VIMDFSVIMEADGPHRRAGPTLRRALATMRLTMRTKCPKAA